MPFNPLATLSPLKFVSIEKGVFTREEIARLMEAAEGDWKGAILAGYYTGGRLGDICNLRWENVEPENHLVRFVARKTGKALIVSLHPELEEYLRELPASGCRREAVIKPLVDNSPVTNARADQAAKEQGISRRFSL